MAPRSKRTERIALREDEPWNKLAVGRYPRPATILQCVILVVLFIHFIATLARLLGPGGVRSLVAESLLLKHQLLIVNRSRQRTLNLRSSDRILAGLLALLVRPTRLLHPAIVLKPSTPLAIHKAAVTPPGNWIRTASDWNEWNLAEQRMPQANDLDKATSDHPVLVRRGGHNDVLNTMGMRLAGLTRETETPKGGTIVKEADGNPTGWLIDAAKGMAERLFPPVSTEQRIEELRLASLDYAAHGITTVRDAFVEESELPLLQSARERGALNVRVRAMVGYPGFGGRDPSVMSAWIDRVAARVASGDDMLRIWGLKFVIDGGAENGATEEPYVGRPDFRGQLMWQEEGLAEVITYAARHGMKVGVHAWGDRAVRTLLDVYERVLKEDPTLPKGTLVLEHGGLSPATERARAITMRIPVTVQHPLLHDLAFGLIQGWGAKRPPTCFPSASGSTKAHWSERVLTTPSASLTRWRRSGEWSPGRLAMASSDQYMQSTSRPPFAFTPPTRRV